MALDIASAAGNPLFLGVVLILFVLAIRKVTAILMNCVWIIVAAVLLPLAANKFLGFPVPADADSLLFYIALGIGGYFVFLLASSVYRILDIAETGSKPLTGFLGGLLKKSREAAAEYRAKKSLRDDERRIKKEGERRKKEEEKQKRKDEGEKRLDEAKRLATELRMKEIEERGRKHTARKENFDDYLVIEDPDAKEEHEHKVHNKKKKGKESIINKFREAED